MSYYYYVDFGNHVRNDRADDVAEILRNIVNNLKRKKDSEPMILGAVRNDSGAVAAMLIKRGADFTASDSHGNTALSAITQSRNPLPLYRVIEEAVGSSETIFERDGDCHGRTILWHAVSNFGKNHLDFIKYLVSKGADATCTDNDGMNLLHALYPIYCPEDYTQDQKDAIVNDYMSAITFIFDKAAFDVNDVKKQCTPSLFNPLMSFYGNIGDSYCNAKNCSLPTKNMVTKMLIKKGIDIRVRDNYGHTVTALLVRGVSHWSGGEDEDYIRTIKTLLARGGREQLTCSTTDGMSARSVATCSLMEKTLCTFWESGLYMGAPAEFLQTSWQFGGTLLHHICVFYQSNTEVRIDEEARMDDRFKIFEWLYEIAEENGLLSLTDSMGDTFLHKLCTSIRCFGTCCLGKHHPIFGFVLGRAGGDGGLDFLAINNAGETPISYLGAKKAMRDFPKFTDDDANLNVEQANSLIASGETPADDWDVFPWDQVDLIYSVIQQDPVKFILGLCALLGVTLSVDVDNGQMGGGDDANVEIQDHGQHGGGKRC